MAEARDRMTFEQFVKASGQWDKLQRIQKDWVKSVSSGQRRIVFTIGRRHGWSSLQKLYTQYNNRVVEPKPRRREIEHGL